MPPSRVPPEQRFWRKVHKGDVCWRWTGTMMWGYGYFWLPEAKGQGRLVRAHRFAYELIHGAIPDGLTIDHLCRNTACVNPAHLEAVTPRTNTLRGIGPSSENAKKTHCVNGHEFTPENTYVRPDQDRSCRECRRAATRAWRRRSRRVTP